MPWLNPHLSNRSGDGQGIKVAERTSYVLLFLMAGSTLESADIKRTPFQVADIRRR